MANRRRAECESDSKYNEIITIELKTNKFRCCHSLDEVNKWNKIIFNDDNIGNDVAKSSEFVEFMYGPIGNNRQQTSYDTDNVNEWRYTIT